jgi:predicted O-methyltransferase YrrM
MARVKNNTEKQQYLKALYCKEEGDFAHIFETAKEKKDIQLSPEEGKLLGMILSIHKAKYVLEIGTLVGYSCCWIASHIPLDGKVITIEKDEKRFKIAKQNFDKTPFRTKITAINQDAISYLENLKLGYQLDAVFIDGKKVDYCSYLQLTYPLLREGGLIIADNTFLFGDVYDAKAAGEMQDAMRKFNLEISDQKTYKSLIFPTDEGLTVAIKL